MARFTQPQIIIEFYEANVQRTNDFKEQESDEQWKDWSDQLVDHS
jgi:hypothetical protein